MTVIHSKLFVLYELDEPNLIETLKPSAVVDPLKPMLAKNIDFRKAKDNWQRSTHTLPP